MTLFLAQSCFVFKMAVRNADSLLESHIEKKIHLSTPLKKELSEDVTFFLNLKKKDSEALTKAMSQLNFEKSDQLEKSYQAISAVIVPMIHDYAKLLAKYMVTLNEADQKEFFRNFTKETEKHAKKDAEDRIKSGEKRFIWFFGTITDAQKKTLKDFSPGVELLHNETLKHRSILEEKFKEDFKITDATKKQEAFLLHQNDYFKAIISHEWNLKVINAIVPTLSEVQKSHFLQRKQEILDLLDLFRKTKY